MGFKIFTENIESLLCLISVFKKRSLYAGVRKKLRQTASQYTRVALGRASNMQTFAKLNRPINSLWQPLKGTAKGDLPCLITHKIQNLLHQKMSRADHWGCCVAGHQSTENRNNQLVLSLQKPKSRGSCNCSFQSPLCKVCRCIVQPKSLGTVYTRAQCILERRLKDAAHPHVEGPLDFVRILQIIVIFMSIENDIYPPLIREKTFQNTTHEKLDAKGTVR